jgi:hypothetical protein
VTAQGHPRAIFSKAIERGNLVVAEASAREVGRLTLEEALRLLFLYAEKDPVKYDRAALRWLGRWVADGNGLDRLANTTVWWMRCVRLVFLAALLLTALSTLGEAANFPGLKLVHPPGRGFTVQVPWNAPGLVDS